MAEENHTQRVMTTHLATLRQKLFRSSPALHKPTNINLIFEAEKAAGAGLDVAAEGADAADVAGFGEDPAS